MINEDVLIWQCSYLSHRNRLSLIYMIQIHQSFFFWLVFFHRFKNITIPV